MAERETETGPEPDPSAQKWAGMWQQSDAPPPSPPAVLPSSSPAGEPPTRSLETGASSTGVNTTDMTVANEVVAGHEILGKIGHGGMGDVFRARHPSLNRVVALKLIAPRSTNDPVARQRFEREFKALANLRHPNIVLVFDGGAWGNKLYFTMQYVPGGALSMHLGRFRADHRAAARLVAKVARAVHHLHEANILHRDLKPHNILLDAGDEPLVADFGLVKQLDEDSDASQTGAPLGTRMYMSPEQTFGHSAEYTRACDIWALGVILYELLAGARPFESPDAVIVYQLIRAAAPTPIVERNPAADPALAAIAHRCLARAAADRYPTAAAVADDLEAWLAGEATTATLPPPTRAPEPHGFQRPWVGLAAVCLITVAAVVIGFTRPWQSSTAAPPPIEPAPAPRPKSVAEQFREGAKSVTLIGAKGMPIYPRRQLPGSTADLTTTADEECVLAGFEFSAVELVGELLPLPVTVTAEIGMGRYKDKQWCGVYAGGTTWAGAGVRFHAASVSAIRVRSHVTRAETIETTTAASAEVYAWPDGKAGGKLKKHDFTPVTFQHPSDTEPAIHWHRVSLTVQSNGVAVAMRDEPAHLIRWTPQDTMAWRNIFAGDPFVQWASPPPVPGPGIGLVAVQCQLYVRNVTVSVSAP